MCLQARNLLTIFRYSRRVGSPTLKSFIEKCQLSLGQIDKFFFFANFGQQNCQATLSIVTE